MDLVFLEWTPIGETRREDVPRVRTQGEVVWSQAEWTSVRIRNVRFLREGVNELTIWAQNPPEDGEAGRDK